jgi:hypothetical protein
MRIIGEIEHPTLKITLFKMDNKLSIKFESGFYEQTYKFRVANGLETAADLHKLVDDSFIEAVNEHFIELHQTKLQALTRYMPPRQENEFEVII